MKSCLECGKEIVDEAVVCPDCGCRQDQHRRKSKPDARNFLWTIFGWYFPLVGGFLFLVWRNEKPLKAGSVGKGALAKIIVKAILLVVSFIRGNWA